MCRIWPMLLPATALVGGCALVGPAFLQQEATQPVKRRDMSRVVTKRQPEGPLRLVVPADPGKHACQVVLRQQVPQVPTAQLGGLIPGQVFEYVHGGK